MPASQQVLDLVARFDEHKDEYRRGNYNETQIRREFIDPLFMALGWDVDNRQGYAEAYKDVVHEDALKIGGATKAPDYSFRIGGQRKFFLEAKKPSVNVKDDVAPAYQLRRYAWSAKLPLSILTDFEEFAVYDCRVRPQPADKASTARVMFLEYADYIEKWDEIAALFSPEAIRKGAFDRYAQSNKRKKGTTEVDAEFLEEIEEWRELLAKNVALRNEDLSQRQLNFAVQKTIDRVIFLRICEDRGIEESGRLQALLNGNKVYRRLAELFRQADDRYNSGLFHFTKEKGRGEPDEWTLELSIDDEPLKKILRRLYYPESPYEFSMIPAEILGQVYEQFLGKVIRLTKGHRAIVEDKPEVKKAGGVYYTPTYIVDYIVENTVGKLLEGKSPKQAEKLRILDPACGSGSFLIGAYQFLLDWHLKWYSENEPQKWLSGKNPAIFDPDWHAVTAQPGRHGEATKRDAETRRRGDAEIQRPDSSPRVSSPRVSASSSYRLTTAKRKEILLNNIYGVDIDEQAVEVTKLSLLLKVLEGESGESIERQRRFLHERALPDLGQNVKCGNSLIGPDFYTSQQQLALFDEEERLRINVFDWQAEFREIMQAGGFDAVIGNPPYVRMEGFKPLKEYLRQNYKCHDERSDLYAYFIEREHQLLKDGACLGKIVSNKFILANYGRPLRAVLNSMAHVSLIADFAGLPVFRGATVRTVVLITTKQQSQDATTYSPPPSNEFFLQIEGGTLPLQEYVARAAYAVPRSALSADGWRLSRPELDSLLRELASRGKSLSSVVNGRICRGIVSGLTSAFVISTDRRDELLADNPEAEAIIRPFIQGRKIRRFSIEPSDEWLIYTHHDIDMSPYPAVIEHLRPFRKQLEDRATKQNWYELQQPQFAYVSFLERPKIVFPDIATHCRFSLDTAGRFGANTVYFLPTDDLALLGLLNSRVAFFYFKQVCAALEGPGESYLRFFGQYLEGFPVCEHSKPKSRHDRLVSLVTLMLDLHAAQAAAKTPQEKTALERQIAATDRQIDALVYELYGLTDEEIRIVEEATK